MKWTSNEYLTYTLLTLVFLSSWTDINGIFAELPQIVLTQPEHWKLGTYLALITNLGNIAPAILVCIKCMYKKRTINPVPINYVVIIIGMLSCFLLVFFWQNTTIINNQKYSTALLTLAFFLSLLDCTSSVSFADYLQKFRKEFTSALFLGESLTSIVPSLLAILQGNGKLKCIQVLSNSTNVTQAVYETARFPVSIYFLCLFLLLTLSFISFLLLQWTRIARNTYENPRRPLTHMNESNDRAIETLIDYKPISVESTRLTQTSYLLLLLGCAYTSSILFGILLSISAYVLMPYGHQVFYLATIISPWMLTIIWLLGTIKPFISKTSIFLLILAGSLLFAFELFVSFQSPCPPFVNTNRGNVLILTVWLTTYLLIGYPRLIIANYVRLHSSNAMFFYGVSVQIGALVGSIITYLIVNTFQLLRETMPCEEVICKN